MVNALTSASELSMIISNPFPFFISMLTSKKDKRKDKFSVSADVDEDYDDDFEKVMEKFGSVIIVIAVIALITWIWAVYALISKWNLLPDWAKVLGVLGLIPGVPVGHIITLIVAYAAAGSGSGPSATPKATYGNTPQTRYGGKKTKKLK